MQSKNSGKRLPDLPGTSTAWQAARSRGWAGRFLCVGVVGMSLALADGAWAEAPKPDQRPRASARDWTVWLWPLGAACPSSVPKTTSDDQGSPCPYLRQLGKGATVAPTTAAELKTGVLENLERLARARAAYQAGEAALIRGQDDGARQEFEAVGRLCPGSRYDRMAAARLRTIQARSTSPPTEEAGAEEQDEPPQVCVPREGRVEGRVAEFLEAGQRAYAEGHYRQARELASGALALDPACVAAQTLVARTRISRARQGTADAEWAQRRLLPVGPAAGDDLAADGDDLAADGEEAPAWSLEIVEQKGFEETAEPPALATPWLERWLRAIGGLRPGPSVASPAPRLW